MSRGALLVATALLIGNLVVVEWVVYALATGQLGPQVEMATFNAPRATDALPDQGGGARSAP